MLPGISADSCSPDGYSPCQEEQGDHRQWDHQKTRRRRLCHGVTTENKSSIYSRCARDFASYGAFWLLLQSLEIKLLKVQHQSCVVGFFFPFFFPSIKS